MAENSRRIRIWKWLLVIILIFSLLAALSAVFLNYRWKAGIGLEIKKAVNTSTSGLYRIEFDDININMITGSISVKNIEFMPDSLVFSEMRSDSIAPGHLYRVKVNELKLNRVHPWKIYSEQRLEIESVFIDRPVMEVTFNAFNADTTKEDNRTAFERLSPYLSSLKVTDIIFNKADFKYIDHSASPVRITRLEGLDIRVSDLLIDSLSQYDKSRLYHTRDIYAELNSYRSVTADSNYTVEIDRFTASTAGRFANIKNFRLVPRYSEMEFSKRFDVQKDRYSAEAGELQLNNIDYRMLNSQRRLIASALDIRQAELSIFLNREMPDSLRNRGLNFPQLSLQRFELDTRIDTVLIHDSRVSYSEYNPDSRRKGTVIFSKINGSIRNVTNDLPSLRRNNISEASLTALLMDRGRFNVDMRFDLTARDGKFEFKGNIGRMDADMFNIAIRPLSLIEIKSGFLERMDFNAAGNIQGIRGGLTCYYNDLKISLLEASDETTRLKRRGIASIYANVLIIESDNPSPGKPVRREKFSYVRPEHSSFFNMIWKGMSSALLGSIGFDAETRREIKQRLRKMEIERFRREERRDDRLKRKEQRRSIRNERRN